MSMFHPRVRALVVGASALALVAVGVGGTVAASNPPTLYACFNTSGAVSMSASNTCLLPGGGRLATINTAGGAGPAGATGVAGPTGATGPTGPSGATGPAGTAVTEIHDLAIGDGFTVATAGGARMYAFCVTAGGPPVTNLVVDTGADGVWLQGGPWPTPTYVVPFGTSGFLWSGQSTIQMAGPGGGAFAIVAAFADPGGCHFIVSH